jgi:hypothetical protein
MASLSKSAADSALATYNRQLFGAVLPAVGIFLIIVVPPFLLYVFYSNHIPAPYKTAVGMALIVSVLGAVQIPFSSLRRNAQTLSAANGLTCPACQTPLGSSYATLKRTGKCQNCGAQIIGAV